MERDLVSDLYEVIQGSSHEVKNKTRVLNPSPALLITRSFFHSARQQNKRFNLVLNILKELSVNLSPRGT